MAMTIEQLCEEAMALPLDQRDALLQSLGSRAKHSVEEVRSAAVNLPADEREALADTLYESLATGELNLHPSWIPELKRRMEEVENGSVQTEPWENTLERMREIAESE